MKNNPFCYWRKWYKSLLCSRQCQKDRLQNPPNKQAVRIRTFVLEISLDSDLALDNWNEKTRQTCLKRILTEKTTRWPFSSCFPFVWKTHSATPASYLKCLSWPELLCLYVFPGWSLPHAPCWWRLLKESRSWLRPETSRPSAGTSCDWSPKMERSVDPCRDIMTPNTGQDQNIHTSTRNTEFLFSCST